MGVEFGNLDYAIIEDVCETIETLEDMDEDEQAKIIALINYGYELSDAIDKADDCYYYESESDYDDYIDELADECYLSQVPETVRFYFDYGAFRRDYKLEATYYETKDGAIIEIL